MKYDTSDINIKIGLFMRKNRISLNINGKELGQKLNISQQHISRFERGKCSFTLEFILRLLNIFDKNISAFLSEVFQEELHDFWMNTVFNSKIKM